MLSSERVHDILMSKDVENAEWGESWAIIDNCIIICDGENPPHWYPQNRDEDGNTPEFIMERMQSGKEAATAERTSGSAAGKR
jgi:hypothetical protein